MMAAAALDSRELSRWAICAAVVVAVHGGLATAMMTLPDTPEAEPSAAIVVELSPVPVASAEIPADIPPGPEQVQAQAVPEKPLQKVEDKTEQKIEEKTDEKVELQPSPQPELAVALPAPKPPVPEPPKPVEVRPPAPATTAPQAKQERTANVAAAPRQGAPNTSESNAIPSWKNRIVGILERNKRYPPEAQSRHEQGVAHLAFSLDRSGRVVASKIVQSSGSLALDQETLALVKRAQPFPPPPDELPGGQVNLTVPIRFNIK